MKRDQQQQPSSSLEMEQKLARWHERLQQVEMKLGRKKDFESESESEMQASELLSPLPRYDSLPINSKFSDNTLMRPRSQVLDSFGNTPLNTPNYTHTPHIENAFNYKSVISSIDNNNNNNNNFSKPSSPSSPSSNYSQTPTKIESHKHNISNSHTAQPFTPSSYQRPYFGRSPQNYSDYYLHQNTNPFSFSANNNPNNNNFQHNNHNSTPQRNTSTFNTLQNPNSPHYYTAQQLDIDTNHYNNLNNITNNNNTIGRNVISLPYFPTPITTPPISPQIYNYTKHVSGDYHESYYPTNKPDQLHPQHTNTINAARYIQAPEIFDTKPENKPSLPTPEQEMHNVLVTSEELEDILKKRNSQVSQISPRSTQTQTTFNYTPKPTNEDIEVHTTNHSSLHLRSRSPSPLPSHRKKEKITPPTTPKNATPSSTPRNAKNTTTSTPSSSSTFNRTNNHENGKVSASRIMQLDDTTKRPYSQFQHLPYRNTHGLDWAMSLRR